MLKLTTLCEDKHLISEKRVKPPRTFIGGDPRDNVRGSLSTSSLSWKGEKYKRRASRITITSVSFDSFDTCIIGKNKHSVSFVIPEHASNACQLWLTSYCTVHIESSRGRAPNCHLPHLRHSTYQTSLSNVDNVIMPQISKFIPDNSPPSFSPTNYISGVAGIQTSI